MVKATSKDTGPQWVKRWQYPFANIFMAEIEIISRSATKPLTWKRYIDDVFSLWNLRKNEIQTFIELANNYHATIKITAEISDIEITFLDKCVYKGERFKEESKVDVRTHFKPLQYTHFSSCHPPGVRKSFIKSEALRLLRINSSETKFEENITLFKQRLRNRGYPDNLTDKTLSEVNFSERLSTLQNKQKSAKTFCRLLRNIAHLCLT